MNTPVFQHLQRQFLAHLRQPLPGNQPSGFAEDRLAVYAGLLYNKFDESLSACFPVLHRLLETARWRALVQDFIAGHRCLSPYYRQIPDEFVRYLQTERQDKNDPPFLAELAHFEWIELVLSISDAEPVEAEVLWDEQLLDAVLVFAPVMRLLYYVWPVQQISKAFQPAEPPPEATHIVGFCDTDGQVRFIALNPATVRLILLLQGGFTGRAALHLIAESLNVSEPAQLLAFGKQVLTELHRQGAIIGSQPSTVKQ